jgi:DNA-binding NtrC family response regulator
MMETKHKLLIVDDDPSVVEFLCESLTDRGFATTGCASAHETLALVETHEFDLIVTDVEMPAMRGTELCSVLLQRNPSQLVLLITAFGSIELAVASVRAGACDFVAKPFKIEALVFAIERAFRDREVRREIVRLRASQSIDASTNLVAKSAAMRKLLDVARRAARTDSIVVLTGETGTGKGAVARFIHESSGRHASPFFDVNCASVPPTLFESELFGARRGAYTDAREDRPGAFVAAGSGTLFLDDVGELPLEIQSKLLHVLESSRVRPLGGTSDVPVRARLIAATNQSLETLLREGQLRPDLYYRLNVIRIETPPLRERREDIIPLVDLFLGRACERQSRSLVGIAATAMRQLMTYGWPGNVRELANLLERAVALSEHDTLLPEDLDLQRRGFDTLWAQGREGNAPLAEVERAYVHHVLAASGGNKAAAARTLGIDRRTLYRKLNGIDERP